MELGHIPVNAEIRLKKRSDSTFPSEKTYSRFGLKAQLLARLREYSINRPQYDQVVSVIESAAPAAESMLPEITDTNVEIGTVYLLRAGRFYKIWQSNAAGRREREIALQLPHKATMVHMIRTDDPLGIEAYWHRRFADRRKNGEWFELSAADVSAFRRRKFM